MIERLRVRTPAGATEEFFLQSQLCVLTLIWCPFHPCVTEVARKRRRPFCQKCRWQVNLNSQTPLPNEVGVGWLCPGILWKPFRKRLHTYLVREHSAAVVSARWTTADWFCHIEWNYCARADIHLKKKALEGNERSNIPQIPGIHHGGVIGWMRNADLNGDFVVSSWTVTFDHLHIRKKSYE